MERKKYIYTGKPLPNCCDIKQEQELEAVYEKAVLPHRYGLVVGEYTKEHGTKSYIVKDRETGSSNILEHLILGQCTEEYKRAVIRKSDDGTEEYLNLTQYFLPFEMEESPHRLPTAEEYITNAVNVQTDALIEVKMVTDDCQFERYVTFPVKTAWPAPSFIDFVCDLEDEFCELAEEQLMDFSKETEDGYTAWKTVFFNRLGVGVDLEFESLSELMRTIVSVRLVEVNNKIIE